jgi:hypothetical protein
MILLSSAPSSLLVTSRAHNANALLCGGVRSGALHRVYFGFGMMHYSLHFSMIPLYHARITTNRILYQ